MGNLLSRLLRKCVWAFRISFSRNMNNPTRCRWSTSTLPTLPLGSIGPDISSATTTQRRRHYRLRRLRACAFEIRADRVLDKPFRLNASYTFGRLMLRYFLPGIRNLSKSSTTSNVHHPGGPPGSGAAPPGAPRTPAGAPRGVPGCPGVVGCPPGAAI